MIAAYLIGLPGSGKSTLMQALTAGLDVVWVSRPFAHAVYFPAGAEKVLGAQIGGHHAAFPGTDRLSMAVQPVAVRWISEARFPVVVGEGDRLATHGFVDAARVAAEHFDLVLLDTPETVAAERRAGRGSTQDPRWLAGRATKIVRLAERYPHVRLDGSLSLDELVVEARRTVPAFAVLGDGAHRRP